MTKKIALLAAGHLSSCPRLLKEAVLLEQNGYKIAVVFLVSIESIHLQDQQIIEEHPNWEFYPIYWNGARANSLNVFLSKCYYQFLKYIPLSNDYIQTTSKLLIDTCLSIKADFYIAHHPSVLVAASKAAKKHQSKYGYDIEDAFAYVEDGRFEHNPNKQILNIERKYIAEASLLSVASPLYTEVYKKNYSGITEPIRVLNVFDEIEPGEIRYKDRKDKNKISLYWVSQTIGLNRGLKDLLLAINKLPANNIELHLRGKVSEKVKEQLLSYVVDKETQAQVFFHEPVSINELVLRNIEHDIGFALEDNLSLNRGKSISNKILDYIRSGLMIAATNTEGHKYIVDDFDGEAIVYTAGDENMLAEQLIHYVNNPNKVTTAKEKSKLLAKTKYNWRIESKHWLERIKSLV